MKFNRRDFLKYGLGGIGMASLPMHLSLANPSEDHFLFMLFLEGGADFSYLFDGRPLEMTQNKLLSNRIGKEPQLWQGANGTNAWASSLTSPLRPYKNDLSIINGVFMDKTFAGHNNMIDLIFSGNPLGGDSFLPLVNSKSLSTKNRPLDGIKKNCGLLSIDPFHTSLIELESGDAAELILRIQKQPSLAKKQAAWDFALSRMKAGGLLDTAGQWSQGSTNLYNQSAQAQALANILGSLDMSSLNPDVDLNFLDLYGRMVQKNMMRIAIEATRSFDFTNGQQDRFFFDTHGIQSDEVHVKLYQDTVDKIAKTLSYFKNTAYDSARSLLDVTTIVVATEFGRTMRQDNVNFETCGTDHNTFCNSFLFAGKGIRGGQVIGASDFQTSTELLSPAHLQLDKDKINIMAKPFDFSTEQPLDVLPTEFSDANYLTSGSVINTLFDLFSMPKDMYRRKNTGALAYPSLRTLLK